MGRVGAQKRETAEANQAAKEQLLVADAVTQKSGAKQQPSIGEHVGVDRPLQLALACPESLGRRPRRGFSRPR